MSTDASAQVVGRVSALRAFPVKSLDAEPLAQVRVLTTGFEGDRGWAVVDAAGQVVNAKRAEVLRTVRALAPTNPEQGPALVLRDAEQAVQGPAADAELSRLVGEPVALRASTDEGAGFTEVAPVHLVSRQAVVRADHHGADHHGPGHLKGEQCPCSVEEPRANLVLDLTADTELETCWLGRELRAGEVVLRVSRAPQHCLGVYADVVTPGQVVVGDPVWLA